MGRFSKSAKTSSQIPTAALPDIIFILLFFFMVATKPKKLDPMVTTSLPNGTQIQAIDKERAEIDLYIGYPKNPDQFGSEPVVEIDKRIVPAKKVAELVMMQINKLPSSKRSPSSVFMFISVDKDINYSTIYDVKMELKRIGIRSIIFNAKKDYR